jgi:hypothetical protein
VEQEIAPASLDPATGLMEKTAERLQKNIKDMPPSVTLTRDPLSDDELGCDLAVCGSGTPMRTPWNNASRHMLALRITDSHSDADELDTRLTLQRS